MHAEVDLDRDLGREFVATWGLFEVATRATSKAEYLLRPDLGRRLDDHAAAALGRCPSGVDLQVAIGDGLSAAAVAAQVPALLPRLAAGAAARGWSFGRPFFVRRCRVGAINDVGDLLGPTVVVLLIGERPGLATAESLSAYLAYRPRAGQDDADRNLISNIHARGTPPALAAGRILRLAAQMMERRARRGRDQGRCGLADEPGSLPAPGEPMTDPSREPDDDATLARLGYEPELSRRMGAFSNFALSFSIICILAGGVTSFHLGYCGVGGAAIGLGWPLGCLFALAVALTMAQVASAFPTAGGLYHWAAILGGRGWGWAVAWLNLAGLVAALAAIDVGAFAFAGRGWRRPPGTVRVARLAARPGGRRGGDRGLAGPPEPPRGPPDRAADGPVGLPDPGRRGRSDGRDARVRAATSTRADW